MCQDLGHFSGFLHHLVLATLATSSIRVNTLPSISIPLIGDGRIGLLSVVFFSAHKESPIRKFF